MNKKIITGVLLCGLATGMAHGATIRYKQSGNWTSTTNATADAYGWQTTGALPGAADTVRANWGGNTITLDSVQTVGKFELGVDSSGTLHVENGGKLTTALGTSTIGNNLPSSDVRDVTGTLLIDAGGEVVVFDVLKMGSVNATGKTKTLTGAAEISGVFTIGNHLWMGAGDLTTAMMDINNGGIVTVGGNIGLGTGNASAASGGTASLNVNNGGRLNLHHWSSTGSIQDGSVLTINEGGTVVVGGNRVSQANDYFTAGKIASDLGEIQATFDGDLNQTTIIAIPEPATLGLVAVFGGMVLFIRRRFMI